MLPAALLRIPLWAAVVQASSVAGLGFNPQAFWLADGCDIERTWHKAFLCSRQTAIDTCRDNVLTRHNATQFSLSSVDPTIYSRLRVDFFLRGVPDSPPSSSSTRSGVGPPWMLIRKRPWHRARLISSQQRVAVAFCSAAWMARIFALGSRTHQSPAHFVLTGRTSAKSRLIGRERTTRSVTPFDALIQARHLASENAS